MGGVTKYMFGSDITALLIIGAMMVLYVTELLPIATTSILSCLALALFNVVPFTEAFSGFGNDIVFLIIGMVVVGDALFETGVAKLIGRKIISLVGTNEKAFMGALFLVIIPISAFISNTATAAMMLPIAASAIAASDGKLKKKNTFMTIGIISVVGGGLTLVGSTPQLIAQGLLIDGGHEPIGFFELSYIGLPILMLLFVYVMTLGHRLQKKVFTFPDVADDNPGVDANGESATGTTAISIVRMCISVAVLVFCIAGFIIGFWTVGTVAMVGAVVCVITGCISQNAVFQKMNWSTVVIMGCSFGIANGLEKSGAGKLVAQGLISILGERLSPWLLCAALALAAVILTNFMSSTATAALLVPIAALSALELGYNVKGVVMSVAIASNIGYATPISTPPMTMTLTAGYRFMDYVKYGVLFNLIAYITAVLLFPFVLNL